jgi:hypothetical protein
LTHAKQKALHFLGRIEPEIHQNEQQFVVKLLEVVVKCQLDLLLYKKL